MGFDAFGLPAENYAIKTGIHPEDSTLANIDTMEKQLKAMGAMFDWDYEIKTCMPGLLQMDAVVLFKAISKGSCIPQTSSCKLVRQLPHRAC